MHMLRGEHRRSRDVLLGLHASTSPPPDPKVKLFLVTTYIYIYVVTIYICIYVSPHLRICLLMREREKERNIYVREKHWLVSSHMCPNQGLNPPRYVPWPGIEPVTWCYHLALVDLISWYRWVIAREHKQSEPSVCGRLDCTWVLLLFCSGSSDNLKECKQMFPRVS